MLVLHEGSKPLLLMRRMMRMTRMIRMTMRFQLLWNVDIAFLFAYQDNNFYLVETINIIIMMHEYDQDQDNGNE